MLSHENEETHLFVMAGKFGMFALATLSSKYRKKPTKLVVKWEPLMVDMGLEFVEPAYREK